MIKMLALDLYYEQTLLNKAWLLLYEMKNSKAVAIAKAFLKTDESISGFLNPVLLALI